MSHTKQYTTHINKKKGGGATEALMRRVSVAAALRLQLTRFAALFSRASVVLQHMQEKTAWRLGLRRAELTQIRQKKKEAPLLSAAHTALLRRLPGAAEA